MNQGWIGVDLDGTLAVYDGWHGPDHIGEPIVPMAARVKGWLAEGKEVRIFTARVYAPANDPQRIVEAQIAREAIGNWTQAVFGVKLWVTCVKDYGMVELWDDRAVRVISNTGERCCDEVR